MTASDIQTEKRAMGKSVFFLALPIINVQRAKAQHLCHFSHLSEEYKKKRQPAAVFFVERVKGIEPSYPAWEADVLPMNYTRME